MKITISVETDSVEQAKTILDAIQPGSGTGVVKMNGHAPFIDVPIPPRKESAERAASVILSERGRLALSLFKQMAVCRAADFSPLFSKAGYSGNSSSSVLDELLKVGAIVRMKRGVYRLPLPQEISAQPA